MDRRVFGLETEYGATCTLRGQRRLSPDEVSRYLFRSVVAWGRSSNVFMENGGRLYLDVGSHPEYATPECDSIYELLAHDIAGELIMQDLQLAAEAKLHEEGIRGSVYVFKNNVDFAGNSYGCHENYLMRRTAEPINFDSHFIPFLITRQIFTGAGHVLQTARGPIFSIAQRSEHIWDGMSSATTRSRPIINTRDEPHADSEKFRRLHVIVGDSNMNECTTFAKVGSALCMLRMIEDETFDLRDFTLENPARAIREISHDITCTKKVKLASGREMSALEIQREFVQRAHVYADSRGFYAEEQQALEMWGRLLDGIGNNLMNLRTEVDWITKLHLIEQFRNRHGVSLDDPRVQMLDLQYHDIKRDRGVFFALRNRHLVHKMCSDLDVETAKHNPPQTTRARLRGEFIKAAKSAQRDYTVDWVHLKLNDHHQRTVVCNDPLKSHDERVDRLISSL